jgi:hypothetical protein
MLCAESRSGGTSSHHHSVASTVAESHSLLSARETAAPGAIHDSGPRRLRPSASTDRFPILRTVPADVRLTFRTATRSPPSRTRSASALRECLHTVVYVAPSTVPASSCPVSQTDEFQISANAPGRPRPPFPCAKWRRQRGRRRDRFRRQAIVPRRPGRRSLSSPGRSAAGYRFGDIPVTRDQAPDVAAGPSCRSGRGDSA